MPLSLREDQLTIFKTVFDLSYHLNYLDTCNSLIPLKGLDVLEVGGCLPASLVIDHIHCRSWIAVESPSYDIELGKANQFHRTEVPLSKSSHSPSSHSHYYCSIESLDESHNDKYDLIFSIACFEHIARLPLALSRMFHCLKPGGMLFTMHSPIWSAYDGHHLPLSIPERFNKMQSKNLYIFPPWGHLLQSRAETYDDISSRFDSAFAEEVIYSAYNSNHINRYFSEDYKAFFDSSDFIVKLFQPTFNRCPSPTVQAMLESRYTPYKQFSNNGILAVLERPRIGN